MGNVESPPILGQEVTDNDLLKLAKVIASEDFRKKQTAFFEENCKEFTDEEENKHQYMMLHFQYEQQVRLTLEAGVGCELINKVLLGLAAYLEKERTTPKPQQIDEALELMSQLGDFEVFKLCMLAKKKDLEGAGPHGLQHQHTSIFTIADVEARLEILRKEGDPASGWTQVKDSRDFAHWQKQTENGRLCRSQFVVDLPPHLMVNLMVPLDVLKQGDKKAAKWLDFASDCEFIKEYGEDDYLVNLTLQLPKAILYVLNVPPSCHFRFVRKRDWPEPGCHAFAYVPFDPEKNQYVDHGQLQLTSGVAYPHPDDPNKSNFIELDMFKKDGAPEFAHKWMYTHWWSKKISTMVNNFKKSDYYAQAV